MLCVGSTSPYEHIRFLQNVSEIDVSIMSLLLKCIKPVIMYWVCSHFMISKNSYAVKILLFYVRY